MPHPHTLSPPQYPFYPLCVRLVTSMVAAFLTENKKQRDLVPHHFFGYIKNVEFIVLLKGPSFFEIIS